MLIFAAQPLPENPLLHEFGLPGLVLGILGAIGGLLLFLWKKKPKEATAARLQIRSSLSAFFRRTVVLAARDLLTDLDGRLPYLLSQPHGEPTSQSRFAYLATALRAQEEDRDAEEDGRDGYLDVLKLALGGLITSQTQRLLDQLDHDARSGGEGVSNAHAIRIEIDSGTELSLGLVADYASRAKRCEARFFRGRRRAMLSFSVALVFAVLTLPGSFIDVAWAYWVMLACVAAFVISCLAGTCYLCSSIAAERWLMDTAERYRTPDDWQARLTREAAK